MESPDNQIQELPVKKRGRGIYLLPNLITTAALFAGFYGIVGTLLRYMPPEELEIVPHVSSLQLAFARAGLAWNEAVFTSAHARPLAGVVGWAKRIPRLGILTDRQQIGRAHV